MPIDPKVAKLLERLARRVDESRAERDRLIREAHAAGASLREIERAVGGRITHVGVKRIIDKS